MFQLHVEYNIVASVLFDELVMILHHSLQLIRFTVHDTIGKLFEISNQHTSHVNVSNDCLLILACRIASLEA